MKKKQRPVLVKEINDAYRRKMEKRRQPAQMTATDMIEDEGVPMAVRLWLEEFVERGDKALASSLVADDEDTLGQARLIRDVLESKYRERGERHEFPEEARDYVEEYLFRLCRASELNIWNLSAAAVAALPVLFECSEGSIEGDAKFIAVESAIHRMTTRAERCEFLTGPRYGIDDEDERNTEAGFKLSRVLADPRTPEATRRELGESVINLCNAANVIVDHPALVRRAFLVACDERPKGQVREVKRARRSLLALLDSIPDEKGGESQ
jgi:hypothetical protein